MLIDWFTVSAQAVNFLILIWLLKRFLYKPILGAMDAREKNIAAQLRDAATQKIEAETERELPRRAGCIRGAKGGIAQKGGRRSGDHAQTP